MSTTITISVYPYSNNFEVASDTLIKELSSRALLNQVRFHKGYWSRETQDLPITKNFLDISSQVDIHNIFQSMNAFEIDFDYKLQCGDWVNIALYFIGGKFENGIEAKLNSQIKICVNHNQIDQPLREAISASRKVVTFEDVARAGTGVLKDWEELFMRTCCIPKQEHETSVIQHAAMYKESGWPSAIASAMLYHAEHTEFAQDFSRIYSEYCFGYTMPEVFHYVRWKEGLDKSILSPGKDNLRFYEKYDEKGATLLVGFLANLSNKKAEELMEISISDIRSLLRRAVSILPEVEYIDLGKHGGALISDPLSSVWRSYKIIDEILSNQ